MSMIRSEIYQELDILLKGKCRKPITLDRIIILKHKIDSAIEAYAEEADWLSRQSKRFNTQALELSSLHGVVEILKQQCEEENDHGSSKK